MKKKSEPTAGTGSNRRRRHKHRQWFLRQRKKQLRRDMRKRRRAGSGPRPLSGLHLNAHTKRSVSSDKEQKITIRLPAVLDFDENYEQTASHFAVLREAIHKRKKIRSLDFSSIESISPSAALVLASEVDQWNQQVGRRLRANLPSWEDDIKRLLCQMGYFELLELEKPEEAWPTKSITFLKFKRGQTSAENSGQLAKQLRVEIETLVEQRIKKHFLFEGLSEAITNVGQHAYRDEVDFRRKQWWLSASYDEDKRKLCVIFYDQGDGIPVTLPRYRFFELIKDVFNSWTDSQKIEAATQIGRSASGLEERGKGLQNLVEFAKVHSIGKLSIFSLQGMYVQSYTNDGTNATQTSARKDFSNSIGGTLIEWSVTL
jgi:hypothetical protein